METIEHQHVDIEEQRAWIRDHKASTRMSGEELAKRIGRAWGTLSQFMGKGYAGKEQPIADQIWSYRQMLNQQQLYQLEMPEAPKFYMSPSAQDILTTVTFAHTYRKQCVIGTVPGLGKTRVFEHYEETYPQVFLATMAPSTAGVMNMQIAVLNALGVSDPKGAPAKLSRMIIDKLRGSGGLLIIDETQHLKLPAIEEIRSWYDVLAKGRSRADFGLVFGGNISMMQRLEGDARQSDFAQIFSRLGMKLLRLHSVQGDADAMCAAWGLDDDKIIHAVREIVAKPGALRQATHVLELAYLMAGAEGQSLTSGHVRESWAQLSMRPIAA